MADVAEVPPPRSRKPSMKRRLAEDDNDEDEAPPPKKVAKVARVKQPRMSSDELSSPENPPPESKPLSPVEDMEVDIVGGSPPSTASSQPKSQPAPAPKKATSSMDASAFKPKRRATKRAVVSSDDDSGDEYNAAQDAPAAKKDDDCDPPSQSTREKEKSTPASGIVRTGKGILSTKIPKKKPTKDDKPITIKDESKASSASSSAVLDVVDIASKDSGKAADTLKDTPKRKLPVIPKKKPTTGSPAPAASASSARLSGKNDPLDLIQNPANRSSKLREMNKPPEVNLFNESTLKELFKTTNTPRTTTTARAQERRIELDKMREEARAKREAGLQNCFDLQAPLELIARFEDKWREANRPIFFPSCLGGALYERHRAQAPTASS